ncbi:MAG: hypothetical protein OXE99_00115 [Cellvibrionales bacterium]|nr:hypothetical protein [Cellvibrionales bacterium]
MESYILIFMAKKFMRNIFSIVFFFIVNMFTVGSVLSKTYHARAISFQELKFCVVEDKAVLHLQCVLRIEHGESVLPVYFFVPLTDSDGESVEENTKKVDCSKFKLGKISKFSVTLSGEHEGYQIVNRQGTRKAIPYSWRKGAYKNTENKSGPFTDMGLSDLDILNLQGLISTLFDEIANLNQVNSIIQPGDKHEYPKSVSHNTHALVFRTPKPSFLSSLISCFKCISSVKTKYFVGLPKSGYPPKSGSPPSSGSPASSDSSPSSGSPASSGSSPSSGSPSNSGCPPKSGYPLNSVRSQNLGGLLDLGGLLNLKEVAPYSLDDGRKKAVNDHFTFTL